MEKNAGMSKKWYQFWKQDRVKELQYKQGNKVLELGIGYDFKSKQLVNMFKAGIIDPYKVERIALETAISIASIFASLDVFCAEFPEKQTND